MGRKIKWVIHFTYTSTYTSFFFSEKSFTKMHKILQREHCVTKLFISKRTLNKDFFS